MLDRSRRDDIGWLVAMYDALVERAAGAERDADLAQVRRWLCQVTGLPSFNAAMEAARRLTRHGVVFISPVALPEPEARHKEPTGRRRVGAPQARDRARDARPKSVGTPAVVAPPSDDEIAPPTEESDRLPGQAQTMAGESRASSAGPRTDARSAVLVCVVCGHRLPARMVAKRLTVHPLCRPVPCRGCRRPFPPDVLVNRRCPTCSRKPVRRRHTVAQGSTAKRVLTPMEQANRERQAAQRREAKRLSERLPRNGCAVCGNHGDHQCGRQWRLADGRIGKRPRGGGSVWTTSGGLPSLGKRSH